MFYLWFSEQNSKRNISIFHLDLLITFAVALVAMTSYLLLQPTDFLADLFDIKRYNPDAEPIIEFRYMILLFPLLQLMLSVFIEVSAQQQAQHLTHLITLFIINQLKIFLFYFYCDGQFLICDRRWFKNCLHFITRKSLPKNKFKKIELDIRESSHYWLDILCSREPRSNTNTAKSVRIQIST